MLGTAGRCRVSGMVRLLLAAAFLLAAESSRAAPACDAMARRLCETERLDCERDCGLLMKCVRNCCESFHDCLADKACEDRSIACMR